MPSTRKKVTYKLRFAAQGLRTLWLGAREVTHSVYSAWLRRYNRARNEAVPTDGKGKAACIAQLIAEMESNLTLLGVTAVEDRLQEGVPHTISQLCLAGIKVWMLTGDKTATARNIAQSCHLLTKGMHVIELLELSHQQLWSSISSSLNGFNAAMPSNCTGQVGVQDNTGLIIDGSSLSVIMSSLDDSLPVWLQTNCDSAMDASDSADKLPLHKLFVALASQCSVVVACRCTPKQRHSSYVSCRFLHALHNRQM